jgi:hypothetical protein
MAGFTVLATPVSAGVPMALARPASKDGQFSGFALQAAILLRAGGPVEGTM